MKVRNGFVSNSSSSSFIIGYNKNLSESEVIKQLENNELFKVSPNHVLYSDMKDVCRMLVNGYTETFSTYEEYVKGMYFEDYATDEDIAKMKDMFDRGFIFFYGSVYDSYEDTTDTILSKITFDYQDENIYLLKDESR